MRLARSFVSGLASSGWSLLITLVTVPFYLRYLGMEAYGLIGFYVFSQSVLQLLDLGLAPTINREVARSKSVGSLSSAAELMSTLAVVYWSMGLLIATSFYVTAPLIAEHWLGSSTLARDDVVRALYLIGLVIACRWPLGLYQGALLGAERMVVVSSINAVTATVSGFGALVVLILISPTIEAFFWWQAIVGLGSTVAMSVAAWREVGYKNQSRFRFSRLRSVWRFSFGMSMVAVSAILLMQIDKLLLSRMLDLERFGQYMLAVVVASGLYLILRPLFGVIFPRMSMYVASSQEKELLEFYRLGSRVLCAVLFPIAAAIAVVSDEIVLLWTQDVEVASAVGPLVTFLVVGTALNGVMHFPYALQLAYGASGLPLQINLMLLLAFVPLVFLLTENYGAVGGAGAWAVLNALYVVLGTLLTHRRFLKGYAAQWILCDVMLPLLVSALVIVGGATMFASTGAAYLLKLLFAVLFGLAAVALNVLLIRSVGPRLRRALA